MVMWTDMIWSSGVALVVLRDTQGVTPRRTDAFIMHDARRRQQGLVSSEVFDILDYSIATPWEQVIHQIEEALRAWLADPLGAWERAFDLQGLSDVRLSADRPNLTSSLKPFHEVICRTAWMDAAYGHANRDAYPCSSAGIFYARSTVATRALLSSLLGMVRAWGGRRGMQ